MVSAVNALAPINALSPIELRPDPRFSEVRLVAFRKASIPIVETLFGIVTAVNEFAYANADAPIEVIPLQKVRLARLYASENADCPIEPEFKHTDNVIACMVFASGE